MASLPLWLGFLLLLCALIGFPAGLWWGTRRTRSLSDEVATLREERGRLQAERDAARTRLDEAKASREAELSELKESFKAIGSQAILDAQPALAEHAAQAWTARFQASQVDLDARKESIAALLKPLEERIKEHQERMGQVETSQGRILSEVRLQLEQLSKSSETLAHETEGFRNALRSGASRGRWGEETLRRVVEAAGLSPHCDFEEQVVQGDSRPDLLVRLPGNRCIIVDAKVPDLDALSDAEEGALSERPARIQAHARVLRETIKSLSDRRYPERIEGALDHVVLFLPAESLFSAALEGDRDLIRWASTKRVLLSTPSSLIALLRSVSLGWQYWNQGENTRQVADSAQELMERLRVFAEHLAKVQKGLESASNAWNQAAGSWRLRILPQGQKLSQLGVESREPLAELPDAPGSLRDL